MTVDPVNLAGDLDNIGQGDLSLSEVIQNATILQASGNHTEAQALYKDWINKTESSDKYAAYYNLGVSLAEQGMVDEAEKAYRASIEHNPEFIQAYLNLGLALERQGRVEQAIKLWTKVIDQKETVPKESIIFALNNIGRVSEALREFDASEKALLASLQLNPNQTGVLQHIVSGRQRQCKWPIIVNLPTNRAHELLASTSALSMLAEADDPALQWLASQTTLNRFSPKEDYLASGKKYNHSKVRIGYLSGDLCTHAVGVLMADIIDAHDRQKFEIYAFDYSPEDGTIFRSNLKKSFNYFFDIRNIDDRDAAFIILNNEIDVLIDLHGWSSGARPGILSLRPAPLQITYLGYFGSTLSPWIDYVITDRFVFKDEILPYFSEKPLYIDGTVIPLGYSEFIRTKLTRESVGLPKNSIILACFNNINKVNPAIFQTWMNIINKTNNTLLWLLDDNPWATNNLKLEAKKYGLDDRISFAPRTNLNDYRERMQLADLYLDTFPYNAGSTAKDVIDMRLPMLTCAGRTPISRMAGSIMHSLNLSNFIVRDLIEYEERAIDLIQDNRSLSEARHKLMNLSGTLAERPIRFVRSLEHQINCIIHKTNPEN